jgi:hypothetical protein
MRKAVFLPLLLAACVQSTIPDQDRADGVLEGTPYVIDGRTLVAVQRYDWPQMIYPVDPATGKMVAVQSGTADTVIISGAPDDRDLAIKALGQFCGEEYDPMGWDTQVVHKDPATGDWWFDGFRCEG